MSLLDRLRARIPSRQQISRNRWLAWLGPWLDQPKLWHWSRRGVAMGVAVGVFFGLLVPLAQIPLLVGAAIVLRVNVPAAVASTLVSNPLTFAPIYYGAYRLGIWVTGEKAVHKDLEVIGAEEIENTLSLWQRIAALGKPLVVGLCITAVLMGLLSYALISLVWRWRTMAKRRGRRR
ncbi:MULTISPECIES: DUF2062 domain-containing protein [unclassified Polaromonas]|uniref:DUF2062 domain-containing protein n=1 Tax=unclassified Polaromonas TaxID=2638319 RepID=UPI0018CA4336|nr:MULTISPECIES: DUF2062 domain-containing protein [unclassified Polaromonas]MBG6071651.1 uncharacterized protein (DUF2062 family) [Polaromonas sp. CG_9.7]MBG6113652.1 uncharacterized protein (DUF2062 family) [Polaromonas sp. CG_9.2]